MANETLSPPPSHETQPSSRRRKAKALVAGYLCFFIGLVLVLVSPRGMLLLYAPLFLAAFVLSAVAMAQGRTVGGLVLFLISIVVPATMTSIPYPRRAPMETREPPPSASVSPAPTKRKDVAQYPYAIVRTFFATDRSLTASKKPSEMFEGGRSSLRYGTCEVSIPRDHRMGALEAPSIWRLQIREDPAQHVVLLNVAITSKENFFSDVANRVRQFRSSNAFLFIHGYNVTFEDAARRTAQISYDLGFEGAPVFYSWPARGNTPAYTWDEQNIEWSQANLRGFLEDFFTRSDAQNVYLIAHSMGNRALTRAVAALLTGKPTLRSRLKEVILTAPDIDADVFKRDIAPALTATSRPITLYASSKDLALVASKKVHGYPRAGDSGRGLVVLKGIETVDATTTDTSFLGHSYFAETRSVLSDMFYLIRNGHRADQRFGLRSVDNQAGKYWEFKP